jgi:hypothetical protein
VIVAPFAGTWLPPESLNNLIVERLRMSSDIAKPAFVGEGWMGDSTNVPDNREP